MHIARSIAASISSRAARLLDLMHCALCRADERSLAKYRIGEAQDAI